MFNIYRILDKLFKRINFMAELKENATIFFFGYVVLFNVSFIFD